jgi:hypothetical protein
MRPSVELIEIIHANQVMYGEPCHLSGNGIFANHVIYAEAPSMAHSIWDAARAHGCHSCERTSSMRARSSMRNMNVLVPNPRSGRSSGAPRRMRATLCKSASAPGHGDETSSCGNVIYASGHPGCPRAHGGYLCERTSSMRAMSSMRKAVGIRMRPSVCIQR